MMFQNRGNKMIKNSKEMDITKNKAYGYFWKANCVTWLKMRTKSLLQHWPPISWWVMLYNDAQSYVYPVHMFWHFLLALSFGMFLLPTRALGPLRIDNLYDARPEIQARHDWDLSCSTEELKQVTGFLLTPWAPRMRVGRRSKLAP